MRKKMKSEFQIYGPTEGDLFMEYLQKMAAEGWMYDHSETAFSQMKFRKIEPEQLHFQWECVPAGLKRKEMRKAEAEIKDRHIAEGWRYVGNHKQMLIFASEEENTFEHPDGAWGKMERIYANLKNTKKNLLFQTILLTAIVIWFIVNAVTVDVIKEDYLEYGLAGAFELLQGNFTLLIMLTLIYAILFQIVACVAAMIADTKEEEVKMLLSRGEEIFYGEASEYEKSRKFAKRILTIFYGGFAVLIAAMILDIFISGGANDSFVQVFTFVVLFLGFGWLGKRAEKKRWGMIKKILLYLLLCVFMIGVDVGLYFALEAVQYARQDKSQVVERATYAPALFGIEDLSEVICDYDFVKGILGSYEFLDVYYMNYVPEDAFYYNYHKYDVKNDALFSLLKKQALKNLEVYDANELTDLQNGWTGYRIEWDLFTEQWFYTDTILLIGDDEILLVNAYLYEDTLDEMLEKILFTQREI